MKMQKRWKGDERERERERCRPVKMIKQCKDQRFRYSDAIFDRRPV